MTNKLNGQSDIYNIVKKEKLDVVNKPIAKAHGLPNECYNSQEYTKIERKKFTRDVKIATYKEFFSIFFCVPCVNKIKSAPTSGININTERIGKFI